KSIFTAKLETLQAGFNTLSRTVVPHKGRRPYFTFTKKYEKTNAVHRNILSVMFYESSCLLFVH
ncbi:hypothetical protein, partial [Bacteroides acidifaciens]|uniref:hypothetical protein n=1 Tax=Bacteroides acidifaciens TaxID=85831 RepID=UPI001C7D07F9